MHVSYSNRAFMFGCLLFVEYMSCPMAISTSGRRRKALSSSAPPSARRKRSIWPLAAEHLTDSCDIGSGASEIAARFPWLDVSSLEEVWWYTDEETGREDPQESRARYRERGFMEPAAV